MRKLVYVGSYRLHVEAFKPTTNSEKIDELDLAIYYPKEINIKTVLTIKCRSNVLKLISIISVFYCRFN